MYNKTKSNYILTSYLKVIMIIKSVKAHIELESSEGKWRELRF